MASSKRLAGLHVPSVGATYRDVRDSGPLALRDRLERSGYDVIYREFVGGRTISPDTALEGVRWSTQVKHH